MTTKTDIDWWAVTQAAQRLGVNTRRLVALHDPDLAVAWALRMSREHSGVASLSYFELAVMLGHHDAKVKAAASLDWDELLLAVGTVQAAVKLNAAAEKKAADEAAAAKKAAAEKAATEKKAAAEKAEAEKAEAEAANDQAADAESQPAEVRADAA